MALQEMALLFVVARFECKITLYFDLSATQPHRDQSFLGTYGLAYMSYYLAFKLIP